MKNIFLIITIFLLISCSLQEYSTTNCRQKILAIKFMNSGEFPFDYGEKMFWDNPDNHAFFYLDSFDNIEDEIKKLDIGNSNNFKDYTYCFIITKRNKKDTIYSDGSLKNWQFKNKGKSIYYTDETGELAKLLRNYSFFRECW